MNFQRRALSLGINSIIAPWLAEIRFALLKWTHEFVTGLYSYFFPQEFGGLAKFGLLWSRVCRR